MNFRITSLLINSAHAIDLMLLVFETAVATIAREFGIGRWEDLMPYTTGAFVMCGIGFFNHTSIVPRHSGCIFGHRTPYSTGV